MRRVSCSFIIFLMTLGPTTPLIYSLKFHVVSNSLTIDFIAFSSLHHSSQQSPMSDSGMMKLLKIGFHSKGDL